MLFVLRYIGGLVHFNGFELQVTIVCMVHLSSKWTIKTTVTCILEDSVKKDPVAGSKCCP